MKSFTRALIAVVISCFSVISVQAKTIKAKANGAWMSTSTWDGNKIPTDKDDVKIEGFAVTLSEAVTIKSLELNAVTGLLNSTKLTILASGNLTCTGQVSLTTDKTITTGTELVVLGNLNAEQGIDVDNESSQALGIITGSTNRIIIGSFEDYGSINLSSYYASHVNSLIGNNPVDVNILTINQGELAVSGDITLGNAGEAVGTTYNSILINDAAEFASKTKRIYYSSGELLNFRQGRIEVINPNGFTDYEFVFNGEGDQYLGFTNVTYHKVVVDKAGGVLFVEENAPNANVLKSIRVKDGSTLALYKASANLDNLTNTNSIILDAGATYRISDGAFNDGLPEKSACNFNAQSFVEFYVEDSEDEEVIFQEAFDYPIVKLTGAGIKHYSAGSFPIDNVSSSTTNIMLEQGTWKIADGVKLKLSNAFKANTAGQVSLAANTTLELLGAFGEISATWDIDRESTFKYNAATAQDIYSFIDENSENEAYGIIELANPTGGALNRNFVEDADVRIANQIKLGTNIQANLGINAKVTLLSDKDFTAFVGAIPTGSNFTYETGAAVVVQKYLPLPYRVYRDLSSPVKNTTLQSWKNAGVNMRGFPGSTIPGAGRNTVTRYIESFTGNLNIGFEDATNVTNPIREITNGQITKSVFRIQDGNNSNLDYAVLLADQGELITGDQDYKITFTATPGGGKDSRKYDDGWNSIGNPFAAPLDWDLVVNDPDNFEAFKNKNIDQTVYVISQVDRLNLDANNPGYYGFYNSSTGFSIVADNIIPSYQGFYVKAFNNKEANEEFSIKIKESHKAGLTQSRFYKNRARKAIDPATEAVEISIIQNGKTREKIWFHHWPGAKIGQDTLFDVAKFGLPSSAATAVDFYHNGEFLNMWVNALPEKASRFELPLYVQCPKAGEYTINFENLSVFTDEFPCAYMLDVVSGKTTNLATNKSYTFVLDAAYTGQRFLIYFNKDLSNDIAVEDATCFGETGKITFDLSNIEGPINYTITQFGTTNIVEKITGQNLGVVSKNLAPGSYTVRNNNGLLTCFSNTMRVDITQPQPVVAKFTQSANSIIQGQSISFTNNSLNAGKYFWYFEDDGSFSSDLNPTHIFNFPGTFEVSLTSFNNDSTCFDETKKTVTVSPSTTSITEFNSENLSLEKNSDGSFTVNGLDQGNYEISLLDIQGRLLQNFDSIEQVNFRVNQGPGVYILKIASDEKLFSLKFSKI